MTMTQQEKDALRTNWSEAKSQVQAKFPDINVDDFGNGNVDPDRLPNEIASRTGEDTDKVEQSLRQIAKQYV